MYIYTLCPFPLQSFGKFCMLTKRKQDWWTDRQVKNSSGIPHPPTRSCMGFNIYQAYLMHRTCKTIVIVVTLLTPWIVIHLLHLLRKHLNSSSPGVSAHPGCILEKCTLGYCFAYSAVMTTCWRLFWAYAMVPSKGCILSNCRSLVSSFWVSIPPEETVIYKND